MREHGKRGLAPAAVDFKLDAFSNHAEALFLRELAGRRLSHIARERVPIHGPAQTELGELAGYVEASDGRIGGPRNLLIRRQGSEISLVKLSDGWANISTAAGDADAAGETTELIARQLRAPDDDETLTPMTFWAMTDGQGPRSVRRKPSSPSWGEIETNYSHSAREGVARLLELHETPAAGLVLWHGPPGTGKT